MKAIPCKGIPPATNPAPLAMRFMEKVEGEVKAANDDCSDTPTYLGETGKGIMDYESD